jgi:hypothetical protein
MNNTKTLLLLSLLTFSLTNCGNPSNSSNSTSSTDEPTPSAYEIMEVAFEGYPDRSEINPMLEFVMHRHNMAITEENLLKASSVLVSLSVGLQTKVVQEAKKLSYTF